jgi:hypothetical protein
MHVIEAQELYIIKRRRHNGDGGQEQLHGQHRC